jgi:hypothetical protein
MKMEHPRATAGDRVRTALRIATFAICAACAGRVPAPDPAATAGPPPVPPPVWRIIDDRQDIRACVLRDGALEEVVLDYDTRTGDSTYQGVPFSQAFPLDSGYAAVAEWFTAGEPIRFGPEDLLYDPHGRPRPLGRHELRRVGAFRGVGVYVEAGQTGTPEIIYLPVRQGCIFQPYRVSARQSGRGTGAPGLADQKEADWIRRW